MNKTILILGGDGYLGWPLALKIALTNPGEKVIVADNGWRRRIVENLGFNTLIPIREATERIRAFRRIYHQDNLYFEKIDVNSEDIDRLIEKEKPHTIYHLAQQASAPFSMRSVEESIFTVRNNEEGNIRLLWAVYQHVPGAHIIKIGSFGEYAEAGIDIPEGYFVPSFRGKSANKRMPYPREANDVYHITKINDSNFSAMACRVWKLQITDVMQSTIFGLITDEMAGEEDLFTRFDYDHIFGTVINRFLVQGVYGYPLTVYGKGNQRTGLMALRDAVNSLAALVKYPPGAGIHKVINHVTERNYSVNELAIKVKEILGNYGYRVSINYLHDPRGEEIAEKRNYTIDSHYANSAHLHSSLSAVLEESLKVVERFSSVISKQFVPRVLWAGFVDTDTTMESTIIDESNEAHWNKFREANFGTERINLNPGTLGTTSRPVQKVRYNEAVFKDIDGYPNAWYEYARNNEAKVKALSRQIWPSPNYRVVISFSTTQAFKVMALSLLRRLYAAVQPPYRVITTLHEHEGGIGAFNHLQEYKVEFIEDDILNNIASLETLVMEQQPAIAFFSHVSYSTGKKMPVDKWIAAVKRVAPDCIVIVDAAQSIGLFELPFGEADLITGSCHKWLFGPHGSGLMWLKEQFFTWLGTCGNATDGFTYNADSMALNISGGQDFILYSGLTECLNLYSNVGPAAVLQRSCYLKEWFKKKFIELMDENLISYKMLNEEQDSTVIAITFFNVDGYNLYTFLNEKNIHVKYIKRKGMGGNIFDIMRIGFPYFETIERLEAVLSAIERWFKNKVSRKSENATLPALVYAASVRDC